MTTLTMSPPFAELEIGLQRPHPESYQVELRFTNPASEAEVSPARGPAPIDPSELLTLQFDPRAYGKKLTDQLFADAGVRTHYVQARTVAETKDLPLRLRLRVDPSAPELHALRWELLVDPETGASLATSETMLFSRFMVSHDWRPIRLRARAELEVLVAVAAPSDLEDYKLVSIDLDGAVTRARASLRGIRVAVAGQDAPLTLERLIARLRSGTDVLYLVCHGGFNRHTREPILYLQEEDGAVASVTGDELARRLAELPRLPRLVVLASCESAGDGRATTAEASLAPRLAAAGVPAVVAMQGKVSMETVERAMPVFFEQLLADGQVDRAMAVARGVVRERPDSWMPALFLRLKGGRIWYVPGFSGAGDVKWKALCRRVRQGKLIPVCGSGVAAGICRDASHTARELARAHHFPLAPHQHEDLPRVAQYLSDTQSRDAVRHEIMEQLRRNVRDLHGETLHGAPDGVSFPRLIDAAGELARRNPAEPHRVLADLEAPIYVNANYDNLLYRALQARDGCHPQRLVCHWRASPPAAPPIDADPTATSPIVYHVLGFFGEKESLVLTEDDYFDHLIATATHQLIPNVVASALVDSSLLFLGFRLTDWSFRILFRQIMSLGGRERLKEYPHVAVQVDPDQHTLTDAEGARRYLEKYFGETARIDVYWGHAEDFLLQLRNELADFEEEVVTEEDGSDWD